MQPQQHSQGYRRKPKPTRTATTLLQNTNHSYHT